MKIHDLPIVDRPREKLEKYGAPRLSNSELLAILLGSGIEGLNVLELSKKILKVIDTLSVKKVLLGDLLKIKGLGKAKAAQVLSMLVLGKRLNAEEHPEILSDEEIWRLCVDIRDSKKEHFVAFYLDTQSRLIERQIISIGTLTASLVHPREVFEPAVSLHAGSVIIAHNHPSGSLDPSAADTQLTHRLNEVGVILGILIENHLIVTSKAHRRVIPRV